MGVAGRKFILLTIFLLAVFLLWPIEKSARWRIKTDESLLAGKRSYLANLGQGELAEKPNILLIVADDLGKYDISVHQHSSLATPNIDSLAVEGINFLDAYATAPICAPSRAALLTGRYQNRFGFESQPMQRYVRNLGEYMAFRYLVETNEMRPFLSDSYPEDTQLERQGLPESEITLAEILQAVGYETAILGKWHLGYSKTNHPRQFGFDHQYGFIEAFSLYADDDDKGIVDYHHDLFWEKHIWSTGREGASAITVDGTEIEEDRYLTDAIVEETIRFINKAEKPFFAYVAFNAPHTPFQARVEDYDSISRFDDENQRIYLAMIKRLDWGVGKIIKYLDSEQLLENTLVIFTSDNGGAAYTGATDNGPLRGGKFTQFEGGLEVPLMVYWKDRLSVRDVETPVLLTDIFISILEILGIDPPDDRPLDSVNLLETMEVERVGSLSDLDDRPVFWRSDFNRAARVGSWKLLNNVKTGQVVLYNLAKDPGEQFNLADERQEVVADLLRQLEWWELGMEGPRWPRVMDYQYLGEGDEFWFAI